jgi:type IX secretion system PorP/SprF family membrane protein
MQKPKYLILFFLVFFCRLTLAQDISNFTQFFFNPYSLNPSFVGIEGRGALFAAYRKQWSGIQGSPTVANLSYHGPLGPRLSMGINVANDERGLLTNSGALITLGYSIPLGEASFLRFGISGGGSWNTIDLDKMQSQNIGNDPALINLLNQSSSVIGNAGLSLHLKSFHIGAALPNLFTPVYVSEDAFTLSEVKPFEAVIIHASNRFYFADNKHIFEPYAVYRINNGLPSQYEFAGVFHLSHIVWLGGSYKEDFGISALGGIKVNNRFALGGSYTLKNSVEYPYGVIKIEKQK